jgi:AsmA family protein
LRLRHVAIAIISLLLVLVLLAGGGVLWLMSLDFRALAERKASEALERNVTVGALHIGWGDPLTLEIRDLRIANMPGGSRPDMVTLEHLTALIDVGPLLKGVLQYRRLEVTRPDILLERDDKGVGNWKFAGGGGGSAPGGFAIVPKDRTQFPTMLDFTLHDATITYRTSSGKPLVVALKQAAIQSPAEDQPITLTAEGAYNDLPATIKATMDSFITLRNGAVPFGQDILLTNKDMTIALKGHAMKPLDFDQVEGALTIDTKNFGKLLEAFDAGMPANFPAKLTGDFTHAGNHWQIDGIEGSMAGNAMTGAFVVDEGPRGGTDKMAIKARYDTLVLDTILGKRKESKNQDWKSIELQLPDKESPQIKADLAAKRLKYGKTSLSGFAMVGTIGPGAVDLDSVQFAMAGTTFEANAKAGAAGKGTRLRINAGLPGGNLSDLLKTFGAETDQIAGQISARIALDATGSKLGEALGNAQGHLVFAMIDGKVSRDVIEKASVDLRTIFRSGEGMSRVKCLLGVAAVKNGVAQISPLILRTPEATLTGGGTIDLLNNKLDLTIRSDPKSTGFFALDIPIKIAGALDAPSAGPDSKSKFKPNLALPDLPKSIRQVAEHSKCLEG